MSEECANSANIYLNEQGRSVFVIWKPKHDKCTHRIAVLPNGDFEVVCYHNRLDDSAILSQIRQVLICQAQIKKDQ